MKLLDSLALCLVRKECIFIVLRSSDSSEIYTENYHPLHWGSNLCKFDEGCSIIEPQCMFRTFHNSSNTHYLNNKTICNI